jgi:PAS domain S-box-containing protein
MHGRKEDAVYMRNRVLLIEDDKFDQLAFKRLVKEDNLPYDYSIARSVSEAKEVLNSERFDIVITDYLLGDGTAFDIFDFIVDIPVIFVTGAGDEEIAVKAMKAGAYDYLIKDAQRNYLKVLSVTVEKAIKHKAAEERLRLLESVVVHANDAVVIFEAWPQDLPGRRILYVNEAFTKMTGYSLNEAIHETIRILQGPKTSSADLDTIRNVLERGETIKVDLINYRKDGSEFWVECNIVPVADERCSFTHWISIQRDITERKRAEEERERLINEIEAINEDLTELNQELETIGAERTMSLMALTVADKVRNPATVIGGISKRILEKEDVSDELSGNLHRIVDEAVKLDIIVKDFQALLDSRRSMFKHDDINRIVKSVVSAIEKEVASKEIKMVINIAEHPLNINMQKELLRMAIFHVLRNAIEAASTGGKIVVETFEDGDQAVLAISDTGYGISREDVEKIFDPFFSTKRRGFGMGLPLVKQIVSEHLGELKIESEPGKGSTFKILFPVRWREEIFK